MDGALCVPDPASRLQDGDIHDASIVTDVDVYPWRNENWRGLPWSQTVLYEIHVGLAGGFRGVQERLADLSRSEEHTSELQSLMRISYAVFCLKKKQRTTMKHRKKHDRNAR